MSKFSVSSITKHRPSKRTIYIAAAVLVLLVLFTVGVISQVRAERVQKAHQAAVAAEYNDLRAENAALKKKVVELETSNSYNTAKSEAVCSWVRGVQAQRRQAVPPLCQPVKQ